MKKKGIAISLVAVLLAIIAIAMSTTVLIRHNEKVVELADEITVDLTENGCSLNVGRVYINDYAKGQEARIVYCVNNNTGYDITPQFVKILKVVPDRCSSIEGMGYVAVPEYYEDFIETPPVDTVMNGESKRYTLKIKIPNSFEEKVPERWAVQTSIGSGTGGMFQVAGATWLLVNMR